MELRRDFGKSDVSFLANLLDQKERGKDLSDSDKQAAIALVSKKFCQNPIFASKEDQVIKEY